MTHEAKPAYKQAPPTISNRLTPFLELSIAARSASEVMKQAEELAATYDVDAHAVLWFTTQLHGMLNSRPPTPWFLTAFSLLDTETSKNGVRTLALRVWGFDRHDPPTEAPAVTPASISVTVAKPAPAGEAAAPAES